MFKRPTNVDLLIAAVFVALITFQPYFLHGRINVFELGIYLPNIDAILNGKVPYRDFFCLRGPFELYMPAALMAAFGKNVAVLSTYFYVGTIITLVMCALIAKELYRGRLFFYLMIPVLVARTFPRVVFTYWGGMRFALGLMAVYGVIRYIKSDKVVWMFIAGLLTALSFLTSMEIGVCALVSAGSTLIGRGVFDSQARKTFPCALGFYVLGLAFICISYALYLIQQHAVGAYLEVTQSVLRNMTTVFIQTEPVPNSMIDVVFAMLNPSSKNFRHATPLYAYIFFTVYFFLQIKNAKLSKEDWGIFVLATYGFIIYCAAFRNLWANAFEMALQPEKIVLFWLLEGFCLWGLSLQPLKVPRKVFLAVLTGIVLSSVFYPIARFHKRFFVFQLLSGKKFAMIKPLKDEEGIELHLKRVAYMTVPVGQARDFEELDAFFRKNTNAREPVLMFPEMAFYYFLLDRPYIGRFPMVSFTWLNDRWHEEFMNDLRTTNPRWAVVPKTFPDWYYYQYFKVAGNKLKFDEVMNYVHGRYEIIASTSSFDIFRLQ